MPWVVGFKLCGNCNPHIEGKGLLEDIRNKASGFRFMPLGKETPDAILVISGCPVDCATREPTDVPVIVVAGETVDSVPCRERDLLDLVVKKLEALKGGAKV